MPAATHVEKDGSFTNTQRLLQWHFKAVEPKEDCRSELWFYYHLGRMIRERLKDSQEPRDRPILDLTWDYPTHGEHRGAERGGGARRDQRLRRRRGRRSRGYKRAEGRRLDRAAAAGSTAASTPTSVTRPRGGSRTGSRTASRPNGAGRGRRTAGILYNRASADPDGKPWSERKRSSGGTRRRGSGPATTRPTSTRRSAPDYVPPDGATGPEAIRGDHPFIMQADGRGWLFVPQGLVDGPLPTHYEPHESPFANPLYAQRANPRRQRSDRPRTRYNPAPEPGADLPVRRTTYRLTEHHTAGGMSRFAALPRRSCSRQMFVEVHPGARGGARARARRLGDDRHARAPRSRRGSWSPTGCAPSTSTAGTSPGRAPYHWGQRGLTTGGAANDLLAHGARPERPHPGGQGVRPCDIRPGRRPRGPRCRTSSTRDARERRGTDERP